MLGEVGRGKDDKGFDEHGHEKNGHGDGDGLPFFFKGFKRSTNLKSFKII